VHCRDYLKKGESFMTRLLFVDNSGASKLYSPVDHWRPFFPDDVRVVDAAAGELTGLEPRDYTHVILSGSESCTLEDKEWMLREENLIRALAAEKIPLLGSCFGHQLIAKALFGRDTLRVRPSAEVGWREIRAIAHDPLWGSGGEAQWGVLFHRDQVTSVPSEAAVLVASSQDCPVQAFKVRGLPIWGVQAHFEIGVGEGYRMLKDFGYDFDDVQKGLPPRDTGFIVQLTRQFLAQ
jgi:GMP synthase-like glutamine amidotransferase